MLSYLALRIGESLFLKELWKAQGLAEGYCLRMLHKDLGLDECCRYEDLIENISKKREDQLKAVLRI